MSYNYTKAYSQYVAWGDGQEMFFRARDRREAKEIARGVFKNAKFFR